MNEQLYDLYVKRLPSGVLLLCRFCVRKRRKMSSISAVLSNQLRLSQLFHLLLDTTAEYPDLICTNCEEILQETVKHITAFQEANLFWRTYFQRRHEQEEQQNISLKGDNFDECSSGSFEDSPIADQEYPIEEIQLGVVIKVEEPDLDAYQPSNAAVVDYGICPIG